MSETGSADRRRGDRVRLRETVPATFGDLECQIVELGRFGARIKHARPIGERRSELRFLMLGERVTLTCRAAHTRDEPGGHVTGIEFLSSDIAAARAIRQIIGQHVAMVLADQRANALGSERIWPEAVPLLREIGTRPVPPPHSSGFLRLELHPDGTWTRTPTRRPNQPAHGFTVLDTTAEPEIALLERTWEIASIEHRPLIRAVIALSLEPDTSTPSDLYYP